MRLLNKFEIKANFSSVSQFSLSVVTSFSAVGLSLELKGTGQERRRSKSTVGGEKSQEILLVLTNNTEILV